MHTARQREREIEAETETEVQNLHRSSNEQRPKGIKRSSQTEYEIPLRSDPWPSQIIWKTCHYKMSESSAVALSIIAHAVGNFASTLRAESAIAFD